MCSYLDRRSIIHQLITALFLAVAVLAKDLKADTNIDQTNAETKFDVFHLSWTTKNTRSDFVFSINGTIKNLLKLESDPNNYLTNSIKNCTNYSACLFRNGTYLESFRVVETHGSSRETVFNSSAPNLTANKQGTTSPSDECDIGNKVKIIHYCSTHWNPPTHLHRFGCSHVIEWHSPITCHPNTTNHERPCHIYEPSGKLIDLAPWVLSNGSSYKIDTSNTTVKQFNLNVCNEAHEPCGPNVAACFIDELSNIVESGYSNLTSIKYDAKDKTVLLTYLGHYKQHCDDSRVKTVVRFICKNKIIVNPRPRLIRSTACESIVEWPSVHACPVFDTSAPEVQCRIKYDALGVDIDIKRLTNNQTLVEVPGIKVNGRDKKMIFGICQAVPKTYTCEGKLNSNTKACLIDASDNSSVRSANNSQIVGAATRSFIRLSDERIYLESRALNLSCTEVVRDRFNITQQVGTRIEFYCSPKVQERPTFLGYDDCTYVFEWGSPLMCLEAFYNPAVPAQSKPETRPLKNITKQFSGMNMKDIIESEDKKFQIKHDEKKPTIEPSKPISMSNNKQPKTNGAHAFFMISIIVMLFSAFIIIIFVLDKKTRLRVTLRQARQAFQPNNQPYSRVIDDLDL